MKKFILGALLFSGLSFAGPGGCLIGYGVSIIAAEGGYTGIPPVVYCLIGDLLIPFGEDKYKKITVDEALKLIKEEDKFNVKKLDSKEYKKLIEEMNK